jgi:hypothetical protein
MHASLALPGRGAVRTRKASMLIRMKRVLNTPVPPYVRMIAIVVGLALAYLVDRTLPGSLPFLVRFVVGFLVGTLAGVIVLVGWQAMSWRQRR